MSEHPAPEQRLKRRNDKIGLHKTSRGERNRNPDAAYPGLAGRLDPVRRIVERHAFVSPQRQPSIQCFKRMKIQGRIRFALMTSSAAETCSNIEAIPANRHNQPAPGS